MKVKKDSKPLKTLIIMEVTNKTQEVLAGIIIAIIITLPDASCPRYHHETLESSLVSNRVLRPAPTGNDVQERLGMV